MMYIYVHYTISVRNMIWYYYADCWMWSLKILTFIIVQCYQIQRKFPICKCSTLLNTCYWDGKSVFCILFHKEGKGGLQKGVFCYHFMFLMWHNWAAGDNNTQIQILTQNCVPFPHKSLAVVTHYLQWFLCPQNSFLLEKETSGWQFWITSRWQSTLESLRRLGNR